MQENTKENRLIEKIKKLFALANNKGALGAESESAMRMANALLAKHSIEKAQLIGSEEKVFCSFCEYNIKTPGTSLIVSSIGRLYNCRVIIDKNWEPAKTLIIGTHANRITAIIVIDQLLDQVKKECKGKNAAYKKGVAIGLSEVCNNLLKERKQDQEEIIPGTGLVALDQIKAQKIAVDDFISQNLSGITRGKSITGSSSGIAHGRKLNPGARVNGTGQKRLSH